MFFLLLYLIKSIKSYFENNNELDIKEINTWSMIQMKKHSIIVLRLIGKWERESLVSKIEKQPSK